MQFVTSETKIPGSAVELTLDNGMPCTKVIWNALIRTHHITSRKKVAKVKQAAGDKLVFVLLRSGGSPGIMYVEGSREGVEDWVSAVQVREEIIADSLPKANGRNRSCVTKTTTWLLVQTS